MALLRLLEEEQRIYAFKLIITVYSNYEIKKL
jgi:hypothetical protein